MLARPAGTDGVRINVVMEPVLHYDGWDTEYVDVIDKVFDKVTRERIWRVGFGFPRYRFQLRDMILKRYPATTLFSASQDFRAPVSDLDARIRYSID